MDKLTHEVRLNNWKKIVEQCQSRPETQTAKKWLAENGINEKTYYYWLRKIRKEIYNQSTANALCPGEESNRAVSSMVTTSESSVSFAEIPFCAESGSRHIQEELLHPVAVIKAGTASIAFSNGADPKLVSGIIREVLHHA